MSAESSAKTNDDVTSTPPSVGPKTAVADAKELPKWLRPETYEGHGECPFDPDLIIKTKAQFKAAGYDKLAGMIDEYERLRSTNSGWDGYRLATRCVGWTFNHQLSSPPVSTVRAPIPTMHEWTVCDDKTDGPCPETYELKHLHGCIGRKALISLLEKHFPTPLGALTKYGPELLHECLNDGTPGGVTSRGQLYHDVHTGKVSLSDLNAAFGQQKKDADESTVVSKVPGAPGGALDPAPEKFLLL